VTAQRLTGPDGVDLAAYDFGGNGPPLVLAHATGFHARVFDPMIERLRATFHCYAFDERGHGASSVPPNDDFDWHRSAADLAAVVAFFGLDRPFGFGHSCGGALLVLDEQARPGTWRAVYAFEPVIPAPDAYGGRPEELTTHLVANPLAAGALRRRADFPSRQAALDNFAGKPPLNALAAAALAAYVEFGFVDTGDGTVTLACRPESEAATYANAPLHRAWDHLGQVNCPVTAACGADSTHFTPAATKAVADRLRRGRLEIIAGLGHFGPLQDPDRVAASVVTALAPSP
jgi:pimeloyl-ACP methyl ester carboxylesterase